MRLDIREIESMEDVPHRKNTHSTVSKTSKRSNHKHEYEDCLVDFGHMVGLGKMCSICGKLRVIKFGDFKKLEDGRYMMLSRAETLQKYAELPIIKQDI